LSDHESTSYLVNHQAAPPGTRGSRPRVRTCGSVYPATGISWWSTLPRQLCVTTLPRKRRPAPMWTVQTRRRSTGFRSDLTPDCLRLFNAQGRWQQSRRTPINRLQIPLDPAVDPVCVRSRIFGIRRTTAWL